MRKDEWEFLSVSEGRLQVWREGGERWECEREGKGDLKV